MFGGRVFFKCENMQRVGAFKARGAFNAVLSLGGDEAAKGVATHSSGNHAQALAYAASRRGIPCTVVMPRNAPLVKVEATRGYGADVVFCDNTLAAREAMLEEVIARSGATLVHPYNNDVVIAGQGTAALELLEEVPDLQVVMAPVGGGGLMSGTAITTSACNPTAQLIGAEPELAADARESLRTGRVQAPYPPITIADGLRTALCERTLGYLQQTQVRIVTAGESSIVRAMMLLMSRLKLVVEPSAAVTVAALLEQPDLARGARVGVILSGGNADLSPLAERLNSQASQA
jgi:threonine dehydratase